MIKKAIQQGHSYFDARSVLSAREHDKMARTPVVAFATFPEWCICHDLYFFTFKGSFN